MPLMRWTRGRRSRNVEDRRGLRIGSKGAAGGGIGVIVLTLIALYFGVDPGIIIQQTGRPVSGIEQTTGNGSLTPEDDRLADFVSTVLADTEDTWHALFRAGGETYQEPKLVLFSGAVESACGFAQSAMGPFYCPRDRKVYIDLSFYRDLKTRFNAPGDFAQAYVIAHEIGHHVQTLLGVSQKVQTLKQQVDRTQANHLSVMQELQADCFAGIWAHHADKSRQILESGDIEEAMAAASAIGDDRLQQQGQGYVTPDSFTHGSSEQRVRWFRRGLQSGDLNACNTFSASAL
jgi:predicted metalloprotease